jgi:hypothetical protein
MPKKHLTGINKEEVVLPQSAENIRTQLHGFKPYSMILTDQPNSTVVFELSG